MCRQEAQPLGIGEMTSSTRLRSLPMTYEVADICQSFSNKENNAPPSASVCGVNTPTMVPTGMAALNNQLLRFLKNLGLSQWEPLATTLDSVV